jgi:hypothetical protein
MSLRGLDVVIDVTEEMADASAAVEASRAIVMRWSAWTAEERRPGW